MPYRVADKDAVRDREALATEAAVEEARFLHDVAAPNPLVHQLWDRNRRAPGCIVALFFVLPGMGIGCAGGKWFYDSDFILQTRGDFAGGLTLIANVLVGGAIGFVLGLVGYTRVRRSRRSDPSKGAS